MKDKEFNLSEKIYAEVIHKEDVKEAVKKLKEEIKGLAIDNTDYYDNCNFRDFEEVIDKIFGDKLVEKAK